MSTIDNGDAEGMNYHQACKLISMQLVPLGSRIDGRTVTGLLVVPKDIKGVVMVFDEWLNQKPSTIAYKQYDHLDVLVVLDNSLAYSRSIFEVLQLTSFA
ncbi:hypothetical protein AQF98_21640 [Pedobacter sp. Hv1]|nr:hypothetical protein AQF98_21640 [Pedobacter sp. Hv1]